MKRLLLIITFMNILGGASAQLFIPQETENGKFGFYDSSGNLAIKSTFDEIHFNFVSNVACVRNGEEFFIIDTTGKKVSKSYDEVGYYDSNNLCMVKSNGKHGLIDITGNEILPCKYSHIGDFNRHNIAVINIGGSINEAGVITGGISGFIDNYGHVIVEPKYTFIGDEDNYGYRFVNVGGKINEDNICSGGKYGYIDCNAKEIIPPTYSFISPFDQNGICWVCIGGKEFISDKAIDARINSLSQVEKDPAKLIFHKLQLENEITGGKLDVLDRKVYGGKYGFINCEGRMITDVIYTQTANSFTSGYAWVKSGQLYGYIDISGKVIVPCQYHEVAPYFSDNVAWVKKVVGKDVSYAYVNTDGKEITDFIFSKVNNLDNGLAIVCSKPIIEGGKNGKVLQSAKYGIINKQGKLVANLKYDGISKLGDGMALCKIKNRFCYVNSQGEEICPVVINDGNIFSNGIAIIKLNKEDAALCKKGNKLPQPTSNKKQSEGYYCVINKDGIVLTDKGYDYIGIMQDGQMIVSSNDAYGYIDTAGNITIDLNFSGANNFNNGYATVKREDKWGIIDKGGNIIHNFTFDDVAGCVNSGIVIAMIDDKWGAEDISGNVIIPFVSPSAEYVSEMINNVYMLNGYLPISKREADIYVKRRINDSKRFNINDTIPVEYWDF